MLSYMKNKKHDILEKNISKIKNDILNLGNLRPGSVSKQIAGGPSRKPREYWQISYTHKMRSRTEYIRDEFVNQIKTETSEYKKLKKLVEKLIEFSIQLSKEKIEILKKQEKQSKI